MKPQQKAALEAALKTYLEKSKSYHFDYNRTASCLDYVIPILLKKALSINEPNATAFVRAARYLALIAYNSEPYAFFIELHDRLDQILAGVEAKA